MFNRNKLLTQKTAEKEFEYDLFGQAIDSGSDEGIKKSMSVDNVYNLITSDGALQTGYGFTEIKMPQSTVDLDTESEIELRGTEVKSIWKLKWYNKQEEENYYYLFYYNDENYVCYDNLFMLRLMTATISNTFTEIPFATPYRQGGQDLMLLSGNGDDMLMISGGGVANIATAPKIKSCCSHYDRLWAITAGAASKLVYNENNDISIWSDSKTKDLDFSDERGDLNKLISFNDYVYIFRDYGITKVSMYGANDDFAIDHQYQSDSYIYPNTISQSGDRVYFLERTGLKSFNGTTVSDIDIDCEELFTKLEQTYAHGTCFEGKYYLACKCDFGDGQAVGCESGQHKNNALIVYDFATKHTDIMRGVDINQVLALNNPYKSKLVACFRGDNKGKIGQLTKDGKFFGTSLANVWQSVKTDFGFHGKKKRLKRLHIKSLGDCHVIISSEQGHQEVAVKGSERIQKIQLSLVGNEFYVKIVGEGENIKINNFVIGMSVAK